MAGLPQAQKIQQAFLALDRMKKDRSGMVQDGLLF